MVRAMYRPLPHCAKCQLFIIQTTPDNKWREILSDIGDKEKHELNLQSSTVQ